jgi:MFS transporter, BCD family, chlorophyll transporter
MRTSGNLLFGGATPGFGWLSIIRLGLVQASLGAVVVLTTSTLNRVMVVELSLAAVVPGFLVGLHYAIQMSRPLFGHGSDVSRVGRIAWIIGGMALLALGGTGAAATTLLFEQSFAAGLAAAIIAYLLIGIGIGASGTSLLALLASRTAPARRPAAATIVWIMMIAGIVVTAATTGRLLDPYSHGRLIELTAMTGLIAVTVTTLALTRLERVAEIHTAHDETGPVTFRARLAETWADDEARLFTVFIFLSMLAYATQDLILEPFGGLLFGLTPGETTQLSGTQHAGILIGMVLVGAAGIVPAGRSPGVLKGFTLFGCLGSAAALIGLSVSASFAPLWPLSMNVALLGFFNGMFTIAAIGAMMNLAGKSREDGRGAREGIRMGVWGAAQAIAFGLGGFAGTVAVDVMRMLTGSTPVAFSTVFALEGALFILSAIIALKITMPGARTAERRREPVAPLLQPAE